MDVDSAEFGGRVELAHRMHELARLLVRRCSEELPITNRRAVARRQHGLLVGDIVKTVERATMSREHASDGLVSPASDFGDLLGRRPGQRVKVKLTVAVTDVDAERRSAPMNAARTAEQSFAS